MTGSSIADLVTVSGGSLAIAAAVMVVAAVAGWRSGRVRDVDTAWGLGFVLVAVWSAAVGDGSLLRRLVVLGLVGAWGLRLAWHVARRNRGSGEDPRYADLLADTSGSALAAAVRRVYLVQGLAVWFVSLPVQVSAAAGDGRWPLVVAGALVWAFGLAFEAVGDAQLSAFKADPDHRGQIMDRGVWRWTRHPNYFGDACLWWGIYLVAASTWQGALTVLSPTLMTFLLVRVTGVRLLERHMATRPGYAAYQARTSAFLPRPPRRGRGS